jgi:hypothetical protein
MRRIAVPIVTARKLFDVGTAEHVRLALIVLDGAAEMLLRKNVSEHSFLLASGEQMFSNDTKARADGITTSSPLQPITFPIGPDQEVLPVTRLPYLSRRQRKKLRDDFGPNADMAVLYGAIEQQQSQVLKDAHHYRNVAYHQDSVDPLTLKSTVVLQMLAVATLLHRVKPMVQRGLYSDQEVILRTELNLSKEVELSLEGLGEFLTSGIQLDTTTATGTYSASISWRVSEVNRSLRRIADGLSPEPGDISALDALRLCQLDEPWPTLDECRKTAVAVGPEVLNSWEAEANVIARLNEPAEALRRFRAVDEPLRDLVALVRSIRIQIDMGSLWG